MCRLSHFKDFAAARNVALIFDLVTTIRHYQYVIVMVIKLDNQHVGVSVTTKLNIFKS